MADVTADAEATVTAVKAAAVPTSAAFPMAFVADATPLPTFLPTAEAPLTVILITLLSLILSSEPDTFLIFSHASSVLAVTVMTFFVNGRNFCFT